MVFLSFGSLLPKIEIFGQRIPKAAFVFNRKNRQRPFGILCITFIMTIDQEIGKITFATNNKKKADRSKLNYEIRAWFQDARKTLREEITSILDIFFQNFTVVRGYGSFN